MFKQILTIVFHRSLIFLPNSLTPRLWWGLIIKINIPVYVLLQEVFQGIFLISAKGLYLGKHYVSHYSDIVEPVKVYFTYGSFYGQVHPQVPMSL